MTSAPRPSDLTPPPYLRRTVVDRRTFLGGLAGAALAAGFATKSSGKAKAKDPSNGFPTKVPPGTSLSIASEDKGLEYSLPGLEKDFKFKVSSWVNLGAGPDIINAFRAHSLDVAFNAGIPPIQAYYQGDSDKIVAVQQNRGPSYIFLTKPHSTIKTVADFRGKKLAFSQGQAQGVVLLRALNQAKIPFKDVTLVQLTSDQFLTALEASQVDIAPVGYSQVPLYLDKYASEGAHTVPTKVVDFLDIVWAPSSVLADEAKLAAIVQFIPLYAKSTIWQWTHKQEWIEEYYVKNQGLTKAQGEAVTKLEFKPWWPKSWDKAIAWEQETANLLAEGGFVKKFNVDVLFDRRFESLGPDAVPSTYWT